jgi:hypothetical protein
MPSSQIYQINQILDLMIRTSPRSILDIGIGCGKFGFLAREYLENRDINKKFDLNWKIRIDGIEGWKDYFSPVYDFLYDKVYQNNAQTMLPQIQDSYDLVLLIDVLEHFEFEEGLKILNECKRIGKNVIISTPKDVDFNQHGHGNPLEQHKSQWKNKDFNMFEEKIFSPNPYSIICYSGDSAQRIKKELRENNIKLSIREKIPFAKKIHQKITK